MRSETLCLLQFFFNEMGSLKTDIYIIYSQ